MAADTVTPPVWPKTRPIEWLTFIYGIAVVIVANRFAPDWWATNPLVVIAVGLPLLFLPRKKHSRIVGVVMVLAGAVWLVLGRP